MPVPSLSRKVIIVDGVTNAGKTTLIQALRKQMPGSTILKFSDYYQKQVQRLQGKCDPYLTEIPESIRKDAVDYNLKRVEAAVVFMKNNYLDDFICERLHPTDYVYQRIVLDVDANWTYDFLENQINLFEGKLVILSLNDQVLRERMEKTLEQRARKNGPSFEIPTHLFDYDNNRRKRDLYMDFFEKSKIRNKQIYDTSDLTVDTIVREIMV